MFHNGSGYNFNLIFFEIFKHNLDKRKVTALPSANCKAKMFSVGMLKTINKYIFLGMSCDNMAQTMSATLFNS